MNKKALPLGAAVRIGSDLSIGAMISIVSFRPTYILYEVTWWDEGDRKTEWLEETEISTERKKINYGFGNEKYI